jgi:hypothetical protein
MQGEQTMEDRPRSPVFVAHDKFKELLDKRRQADEMLSALLRHPRFKETGDGIFEINEILIRSHEALCDFVTAARRKYPMRHFTWNLSEFDRYERPEEVKE